MVPGCDTYVLKRLVLQQMQWFRIASDGSTMMARKRGQNLLSVHYAFVSTRDLMHYAVSLLSLAANQTCVGCLSKPRRDKSVVKLVRAYILRRCSLKQNNTWARVYGRLLNVLE